MGKVTLYAKFKVICTKNPAPFQSVYSLVIYKYIGYINI